MKFLIDTNILIPAEPTSLKDVELTTPIVTQFLGLAAEAKCEVFVHPASVSELSNDSNKERKQLRSVLVKKYQQLPSPPKIHDVIKEVIGNPPSDSHDAIDNQLLAAVFSDAVDYLVTSDIKIHKKAERLELQQRVYYPESASSLIHGFLPVTTTPPPAVKLCFCHELEHVDPIFDSIRSDYEGFDDWLTECKRTHREVFVIQTADKHDALAILKEEDPTEEGFDGKVLKICTFKVADHARGLRYGELLLKAIFEYMRDRNYDVCYLTCYPRRQEPLINLLRDFGFFVHGRSDGEILLAKRVNPTIKEYHQLTPHDYNVRFGPQNIKAEGADIYAIPIIPRWHKALFPDLEKQRSFFDGVSPFGNSIRKAYICNSSKKELALGSILLFYRSGDFSSIRCIGVVDDSKKSSNPDEIIRFVGQRTVYTAKEIEAKCAASSHGTLAVLFRQAKEIDNIPLATLIDQNVLIAQPQSITMIKPEGRAWMQTQIEA